MKIEIFKLQKKSKILSFLIKYKKQIIFTIFLGLISIFFILNSSKYIDVVLEGILLYGTKILPSLLPFFFLTKIISNFDFILYVCSKFSFLTKFLFNTKSISSYIFFMSIISGYPMGAKLTSEFYENKLIEKNDAEKILSFCSTSGPLFVIGSVGVGFFCNETIGIFLFISHILSSILNGILYRNINKTNFQKTNDKIETKIISLEDCMYNSIRSVLLVGGYIIIFYVLIQIMLDYNLLSPLTFILSKLGLTLTEAQGLSAGLIEITKGISILSTSNNLRLAFVLTSGLISFSGISILMQSFAFLEKLKINKKLFVLQKITHSIISIAISYLICFILF